VAKRGVAADKAYFIKRRIQGESEKADPSFVILRALCGEFSQLLPKTGGDSENGGNERESRFSL